MCSEPVSRKDASAGNSSLSAGCRLRNPSENNKLARRWGVSSGRLSSMCVVSSTLQDSSSAGRIVVTPARAAPFAYINRVLASSR